MSDPMDLVRHFYAALNRADLKALTAFYEADAVAEHVFTNDDRTYEGRDAIAAGWRREFAKHQAALAGGGRIVVSRIAGIETGWGWVRADWISTTKESGESAEKVRSGYSHFWIEHGLIRRQRSVVVDGPPKIPLPDSHGRDAEARTRDYPSRPIVGVGAVIRHHDGRV